MRAIVRALHNEGGVALAMTLVLILVLTAIVLAITYMSTGELEIHRVTRWDTLAQYLGQAGVEHQIYLLKADKNAGAIPYTNYPVLPSETTGFGAFWYRTSLTCYVNCTAGSNPEHRRWIIDASGEVRLYDPVTATWSLLQQRTIRVLLRILYITCGALTNGCPTSVTLLRWEELYP